MKRLVALLLVFTMVFALCACGKKDEAPAPKSTLAPEYDIGPSPEETDYVSIEDVKLVLVETGKARPNIKVRCLYPKGELETYPNRLWINCYYLNSDDEVIQNFTAAFKHPAYNQVVWSKSNNYSHMNGDDVFYLKEVSKIQFVWYKFQTIEGGKSTWQRELDFLSPISFDVANLEIENT